MPHLATPDGLTAAAVPAPVAPLAPASPRDPRIGQLLGKYNIHRRVGQGGMGVVYEAEDTLLKRRVALKFLPHAVSADPHTWQRFLLEARAAARLNHPNAVAIYEIDQRDGASYLAMEFVEGGSTHEHLKTRGPYAWPEATYILAQVCHGLQAAHTAGLIHRDIKPANIMRGRDGSVKLADFGLAKATDSSTSSITGSHSAVGTPSFMSPEQCQCETVDARSDLYALGATYYALLTGKPPYGNAGPLEVMFAHCSRPAPDPREVYPEIPAEVAAIVQKAMTKAPEARYQSSQELLAALEAVLQLPGAAVASPPRAKRPSTVVLLDTVHGPPVSPRPPDQGAVPTEVYQPLPSVARAKKLLLAAAGVLAGLALGVVTFFQPGTELNGKQAKIAAAAKAAPPPPPRETEALIRPVQPPQQGSAPRPSEPRPPLPPPTQPPREVATRQPRRPRVLMVLPSAHFVHAEYTPVRRSLEERGAEVLVASSTLQPIRGEPFGAAPAVFPDLHLDRVQARDFDALILTGGKGVNEFLGESATAVSLRRLVSDMHRLDKTIGTIGLSTGLLLRNGILRGVEVCAPPFLHVKMREEGATVVMRPLSVSQRIVTARDPMACGPFANAMAREMGLRP